MSDCIINILLITLVTLTLVGGWMGHQSKQQNEKRLHEFKIACEKKKGLVIATPEYRDYDNLKCVSLEYIIEVGL